MPAGTARGTACIAENTASAWLLWTTLPVAALPASWRHGLSILPRQQLPMVAYGLQKLTAAAAVDAIVIVIDIASASIVQD